MALTDTQCRTAKPREKAYKLTDGNGLYLEVKPKESLINSDLRITGVDQLNF